MPHAGRGLAQMSDIDQGAYKDIGPRISPTTTQDLKEWLFLSTSEQAEQAVTASILHAVLESVMLASCVRKGLGKKRQAVPGHCSDFSTVCGSSVHCTGTKYNPRWDYGRRWKYKADACENALQLLFMQQLIILHLEMKNLETNTKRDGLPG